MRFIAIVITFFCFISAVAQKVTVNAIDEPAADVFRSIMEQTGKNFVYPSELLRDMKVSVQAENENLKHVLRDMFHDTDIEFRIKGKDVVLKRKRNRKALPERNRKDLVYVAEPDLEHRTLEEIVVISRLEAPAVETTEIGAKRLSESEINNVPVLFGENDVVKALLLQPGITEGAEGMAGMHVHGGEADENLFMLDNVPIYQANHFAGLFSAFNTEAIRNIDFFKSSAPAKYDGRLSSFLDVRTKIGQHNGHHGTGKLGLTSGAFNISGPIGKKTTYLAAIRRSWYDVLTSPIFWIVNSKEENRSKVTFHYYFTDLNAKINHSFSDRTSAYISAYFGNDLFKAGEEDKDDGSEGYYSGYNTRYHWGNFVAQAGVTHRYNDKLFSEFTLANTRFFSAGSAYVFDHDRHGDRDIFSRSFIKEENKITDWIARADFDWTPDNKSRIRFGGNYTVHSFLPSRTTREFEYTDLYIKTIDSTWVYHANEINAYIEDDCKLSDRLRMNAGLHASVFFINGKTRWGLSPRVAMSYHPHRSWSFKAAYTRTVQYVHQLCSSYLSLPTDQWIPITGHFKPQTADKIAVGAYWRSEDNIYAASAEAYCKFMHNIIDYKDEYYLIPPLERWNDRLTSGKGSSKGIDLKFEKTSGKLTGHIAYTLAWADRTFADKNGGKTYPARFDNRHTIKILLNWQINKKVQLNAAWTGHSGNRFTFMPQLWEMPSFGGMGLHDEAPLATPVNNYQLPFYHRLDLACTVRNSRGYWTFSLYNAYNNMNAIGIKRAYKYIPIEDADYFDSKVIPVFEKISLLPVIPSISYTWEF